MNNTKDNYTLLYKSFCDNTSGNVSPSYVVALLSLIANGHTITDDQLEPLDFSSEILIKALITVTNTAKARSNLKSFIENLDIR